MVGLMELTEAQKNKIEEVRKEAKRFSAVFGICSGLIGATALIAVNVVNQMFVKSDTFVVSMTCVTVILFFKECNYLIKIKETDLREKLQDILNNK